MRSGRLHIAGFSTGPTPFAVNLAGAVPFAIMGADDGRFGYTLQVYTQADSDIQEMPDLAGKRIAHTSPTSNSGNQAPRALFPDLGVVPDEDYEVNYSGSHDQSMLGVVAGDYDAAPVASEVVERMAERGLYDPEEVRIVWESDPLPDDLLHLCARPRARAEGEDRGGVLQLRLRRHRAWRGIHRRVASSSRSPTRISGP